MSGSIEEHREIYQLTDRLFISQYQALFNKYLSQLDDNTKHIIRNNRQLNNLYDLFLDFIIDSSQHLDYINAREEARKIATEI
ncbi:MAG: hypothetical protein EBU90_19030 [Proteobacteria bacterium]|nr:hypothetical protein [Pseudomonadota bacterium]NBP15505.1 hypothetical protein [bacterium]